MEKTNVQFRVGSTQINIGTLRINPGPAPATVHTVFLENHGRHVEPIHHYTLTEEEKQPLARALAQAGVKQLTVKVFVGTLANMRNRHGSYVTLGEAHYYPGEVYIFLRNIVGVSYSEIPTTQEYRKKFIGIVAHEIGHMVHFWGRRQHFNACSALEKEYVAEEFVATVFGPEYSRPVYRQFYQD